MGVKPLAVLERGGMEIWVEATDIKLLPDVRMCLEVLLVLIGMCPDTPRRISLGVDLSKRTEINIRWGNKQ